MALIQIEKGVADMPDLDPSEAFDCTITNWWNQGTYGGQKPRLRRGMAGYAGESLTDLILQKLLRVKQIENNQGFTRVSEGVDVNYQDMNNFAVFALIHLGEKGTAGAAAEVQNKTP